MESIFAVPGDTRLASVRSFFASFMEKEPDRALMVPIKHPDQGTVMPTLITDPELLAHSDPFSPCFPINGAKLVSKLTRKSSGESFAVFLRPCEAAALTELVKIKQACLDDLVIITAHCPGAYSNRTFRAEEGAAQDAYTEAFLEKRMSSGFSDTLDDHLATACRICSRSFDETADIVVGLPAGEKGGITLKAGTEKGRDILAGMTLEKAGAAPLSSGDIEAINTRRKESQDALFSDLGEKTSDIPALGQYLSACINCYNCRVACPVCFCKECVFNTDAVEYEPFQYQGWARARGGFKMPGDTLFFHMTRMIHMGLSCVGCGQCSNACPNDIPLAELFKRVGERAQTDFGYVPGRNPEEAPPLSIFHDKEYEDVTGIAS